MIPTLRLPGGAVLAAEAVEGARSFAVGFWFPVGSRHETERERGFVHFVEHMAFKGTSRRGAADISREIDRVGGYLNAFTDRDSICFHCQVPSSRWKMALDVLADMSLSSLFRQGDFEREREVIISEILSARDDPEERSNDEFLASVWPSDPLARKIAGEPQDIRRIKRDELFAFYRAELSLESLLVVVSGPVASDEVAEELSRLLRDAGEAAGGRTSLHADARDSGPPALRRRQESTPAFSPSSAWLRSDMEQVNYYEAVQLGPPFAEVDYYALAALNGAIGEASSSRLFLSLREDRGLCYSVSSAFSMSRTECLWVASANVSEPQLPALAAEMGRLIDRVAGEGLGDEECADAISRLAGSFDLALEDTDFRMRRIARQVLFSGEAMAAEEARALIGGLEPTDLDSMRRRLLNGRRRARFAYGGLSRRTARASGLAEAAPHSGARLSARAAARRG
jgi:predicted Zn-dependent peptidase